MKFVKLTDASGTKVYVNVEDVRGIYQRDGRTFITFKGDTTLMQVTEPLGVVLACFGIIDTEEK